MSWNGSNSYGTTVDQKQLKAYARWTAEHLKRFGWKYAVADMQWCRTNPVLSSRGSVLYRITRAN